MKPQVNPKYPVNKIITDRWSPRAFSMESLTHEQMNQLFEAMRWAASCYNEQPWNIIYAIRSEEENFQKLLGCLVEWNQSWAHTAGALAITVTKEHFKKDNSENIHAWHDLGLAIGNLTTQATDMGIYVHQMGGIEREKIRELFDIPEGYGIATGIAFGYPGELSDIPEDIAEDEHKPQERKPVSDFAFNADFKIKD